MTVCVAAICETGAIFGASDEMITAGDIEFEPRIQKIWRLTNSIAMMVAGDIGLHSEFWSDLYGAVQQRLKTAPARVWRVREVASLYQQLWLKKHSEMAERDLLIPLGLNLTTFISRQDEMAPEFARRLADNLRTYPQLDVDVLIAGVDDIGSHIYVVEQGEVSCKDPLGFAAIGVGAVHANSHFMISGHTRFETIARTLFRTYVAKRRAEVAPGVGDSATDMFVVGPGLDTFNSIPYDLLRPLEQTYMEHIQGTRVVAEASEQKVEQYLMGLAEAAQAQQAPTGGASPQTTGQAETAAGETATPKPKGRQRKAAK